jgi:mgtE-like transporter
VTPASDHRRRTSRIRRPRLPGPLRTLARVLRLPATEVARYWVQERVALRRGLAAILLTSVTGMVAGLTLAAAEDMLERLPGLLLLVPAAIAMRGNIYGALASRLSTALHIGTYETELRRHSFLGRQIEATTLLTVGLSVITAILAWVLGAAIGLDPISIWKLVVISTVGGVLASVVLLLVTVALSLVSQRRDWNLDDVGAPAVTVAGDILTIPALLGAALIVEFELVAIVLGVLLAAVGAWALLLGWIHADPVVQRISRESVLTLTIAAGVGALAGAVLEARIEQWIAAPVLLIMIPSFIANCGSLGGILSSRLASKIHLGAMEPRLVPDRVAALDISVAFFFATFAFSAIGVTAWVTAAIFGFAPPGIGLVVGVAVLAGLLSTVLLAGVAHATAVASYRFGLDPDNEGIPVVTSAMDLLGLLCLVGVVAVLWGG